MADVVASKSAGIASDAPEADTSAVGRWYRFMRTIPTWVVWLMGFPEGWL